MKLIVIMIVIFASIVYVDMTACNKKGSIAAKTNWAGNPVCTE